MHRCFLPFLLWCRVTTMRIFICWRTALFTRSKCFSNFDHNLDIYACAAICEPLCAIVRLPLPLCHCYAMHSMVRPCANKQLVGPKEQLSILCFHLPHQMNIRYLQNTCCVSIENPKEICTIEDCRIFRRLFSLKQNEMNASDKGRYAIKRIWMKKTHRSKSLYHLAYTV